jgi:hypothetical protein
MDGNERHRPASCRCGRSPARAGPAPEAKSHPNGGYLVKVAYLLVTTAWLVGAQAACAQTTPAIGGGDKKDPPIKKEVIPAPVTVYGDCGGGCCESGGGFWSRCRGLFHRNDCDSCSSSCCQSVRPTCCQPTTTCCQSTCAPRGCSGWTSGCGSSNTCGDGCGGGFWSRCRQYCGRLFHRNDCCDSCGSGGPGYKGETIPPPKEDPAKKMPGGKEVLNINPLNPAPVPAPALDSAPPAPAITPARPGDERPF